MKQAQGEIAVSTRRKGLYDITREIRAWVRQQKIATGLLTVFLPHTSPENTPWFRHTDEGPDDMPSHIRSTLTAVSLTIPVRKGAPALGVWQAVYVFEHRSVPHRRRVLLHLIGEGTV